MEFEKLNYVPEKPTQVRGQWATIADELMGEEETKTVVFKLKNDEEYKRCQCALYHYVNSRKLPLTIWTDKGKMQIYLIKA